VARPATPLSATAVVAAAADLADADGPGALTLAGVAAHLGVRTPSLYNHVAGLDDLHRRLALLVMTELADRLRSAAVGLAGPDAVRALLRAARDYALAHPGRYGFVARAPGTVDNPAAGASDTELAQAAGQVVDVFLAGLRAYGLTGDQAVHAVRALRSAVHGFVMLETGGGFGLPQDLDDSFATLVELLVAGLEARVPERG
jgi:AcrR family transcriptional regulator